MRNLTAKELAAQLKRDRKPYAELKRKLKQQMLESGHIECPECGGEGEREYERSVIDWNNGGYLEGYIDTCDTCEGEGYLVEDE